MTLRSAAGAAAVLAAVLLLAACQTDLFDAGYQRLGLAATCPAAKAERTLAVVETLYDWANEDERLILRTAAHALADAHREGVSGGKLLPMQLAAAAPAAAVAMRALKAR